MNSNQIFKWSNFAVEFKLQNLSPDIWGASKIVVMYKNVTLKLLWHCFQKMVCDATWHGCCYLISITELELVCRSPFPCLVFCGLEWLISNPQTKNSLNTKMWVLWGISDNWKRMIERWKNCQFNNLVWLFVLRFRTLKKRTLWSLTKWNLSG